MSLNQMSTSKEIKVPNVYLYYIVSILFIKIPLALFLFEISLSFGFSNSWLILIPCFISASIIHSIYDSLVIEMTSYIIRCEFEKKVAEELAKNEKEDFKNQ